MEEIKSEELLSKDYLKSEVIKTKAQLTSLNILADNCNKLKLQKKLVISETPIDESDPRDLFVFTLTGDIVLRIMVIVDDFIDASRAKLLEMQDKLIDELNKYI